MRELAEAPERLCDATGTPHFGSYRGALPRVDYGPLGRGALFRAARQKRWMYVAIAAPDAFVAVAIVRLGYLASSFAFAVERGGNRLAADCSSIAPPWHARVGERSADDPVAAFRFGAYRARIERPAGGGFRVDVETKDLAVHASLDEAPAPPPLAVIARIPGAVANATEKRALLDVRGEARVAGRRIALDGALAGYDYTNGLLARHTAWKWAFVMGRAKSGERVGLNLVEGFVGAPECAVWIAPPNGGPAAIVPLAEGRFEHDREAPERAWRVRTSDGAVDLVLSPIGVHAEHVDLGVVRSRFVQPSGAFTGTIALPGREPLELDGALGVTEDQDVLW